MNTIAVSAEDNPAGHPLPRLLGGQSSWQGRFEAMASPCEILADGVTREYAERALAYAAKEAWRLEQKFSRYVSGNPVDRINRSRGEPVTVDEEMALMLDYAAQCHDLSDGRFDITSGVLRRAWRFDGSDNLPEHEHTSALLKLVGWNRLSWQGPQLTLPAGMEIDFGGIGKEYAVDRVLLGLKRSLPEGGSVLVNFGGDLACSGPRTNGKAWIVGMEDHQKLSDSSETLSLHGGALATSGDSRRYLLKNGVRYSHILDPHTGWPVPDAPHSVTVAAPTCTLAGMLATFAMLQGAEAERFLEQQDVQFWVQR
ncbi:FAD:protein FMN transferase [Streptosporangium jomthongense]|uniref:FAD:protein FMN transferase n=1 Tax=Marinobacter aromaticivorans TaxID=1494078 RepID=A0ABW2IQV5_9GAMM|nr:FAD:protein FMN transferase [Marinobacter aromaticivorans]GGE53199.1 FAD:protein FMN transferase [Streptosporangium jomthongense]